ncbi:MAG: glycosyltransferase family 2 protein [Bacillota bacterium]|jgi:glycosyltransferase involved in cell wall biosynthesis
MDNMSVIIPAYNEELILGDTIRAIKDFYHVNQIIVVDDGSKDKTSLIAQKLGAQVIIHKNNLGKGSALNSASHLVTGDIIVLLDADLGKSAGKFYQLIPPILTGKADVTLAKFSPPPVPGGFGLVKGLASISVFILTGQILSSPLSGQRAMTKEVFKSILPFAGGYGVEIGATVEIIKKGWRLQEVEIDMVHRFTKRDFSGFLHRGRQFYDICCVLAQKIKGNE